MAAGHVFRVYMGHIFLIALSLTPSLKQMKSVCNARNGRMETVRKGMFHFLFAYIVIQRISISIVKNVCVCKIFKSHIL